MRGRIRHADYTDQPGSRHPGRGRGDLTDGDRLSERAESGEAHHPAAPSGRLPCGHEAGSPADRPGFPSSGAGAEPAYLHPCGPAGDFVDDYPVYRSGLRGSAHDQPGGGAQRHWTGGVSGHPGHSVQPGRRHPGAALQALQGGGLRGGRRHLRYGAGGGTGLHQAVYRGQQGDLRTQRTDFRGKDHQLQHGRAEESRSHLQRLL